MRIVPLADIQSAITAKAAIEAVKAGFIAHARGQVHCPEPVQIVFRDDQQEQHGECHVKSAIWSGRPYAAVKIASGSYRNAARGLPGAGGMIIMIATDTGLPEAILHDECWLTNVRTAAAGALAAGLKPVSKDATLGVIGTGTQAEMQATMICSHLGLGSVSVWGRSAAKAATLCQKLKAGGLAATPMDTVRDVCHPAPFWSPPPPLRNRSFIWKTFPKRSTSSPSEPTPRGRRSWTRAFWEGPTPSSPTTTGSVCITVISARR